MKKTRFDVRPPTDKNTYNPNDVRRVKKAIRDVRQRRGRFPRRYYIVWLLSWLRKSVRSQRKLKLLRIARRRITTLFKRKMQNRRRQEVRHEGQSYGPLRNFLGQLLRSFFVVLKLTR